MPHLWGLTDVTPASYSGFSLLLYDGKYLSWSHTHTPFQGQFTDGSAAFSLTAAHRSHLAQETLSDGVILITSSLRHVQTIRKTGSD